MGCSLLSSAFSTEASCSLFSPEHTVLSIVQTGSDPPLRVCPHFLKGPTEWQEVTERADSL